MRSWPVLAQGQLCHSRAFSVAVRAAVSDRYSFWCDRETKRTMFVGEPYELAIESKVQEYEDWAQLHCFSIVKPELAAMHQM